MDAKPVKKPKFSLAKKDEALDNLVSITDQKTLAIWAIDCTERVIHYFEDSFPQDKRPRKALDTLNDWIESGEFKMAVIRKASLDSHAAAREVGEDNAARSVARSAGQAVATAHVPRHSLGAALYAQQAIHRVSDASIVEDNVNQERDWQYQRLLELSGS